MIGSVDMADEIEVAPAEKKGICTFCVTTPEKP
jgi:hypothetical protein